MAESLLHAALHKLPSWIIPEGAQGVNSALFYLKEVFTMGYEKIEKIINALTIIQDICKTRPCDMCPFKTSDGECGISNKNPVWWDINSFDDWRAFK